MNSYEIWCDLRPGQNDLEFCESVGSYLGHLLNAGFLESFRVRRRKLGFAPDGFGEFNITLEFCDMTQMDQAFLAVARRSGELEELHKKVYSSVVNAKFALYRDFPDEVRVS